jgi:hypothetical protein
MDNSDRELEEMLKQSNLNLESFNNQILQIDEIEKEVTKNSKTDLDSLGQKIKSYEEISCKVDILKSGKTLIELFQSIFSKNDSIETSSNLNKLKECV